MSVIELVTPLKESDVRKLRTGDLVYISGRVFTGRSGVHIRLIEENVQPPIDLSKSNVMWHLGPVMKKKEGEWIVYAAGATTSIRFEKWAAEVIRRFNIRGLIGKGTMGQETLKACKEAGCVHLGKVGMTTGALYAGKVKKVLESHWLDMGTSEALWVLQVDKLGPFVVSMDSKGKVLYEKADERILNKGLPNAERLLGIEDFEFAEM